MSDSNAQPAARKMRDSNMELLRIVAILLIFVVHANFRALDVPTASMIAAQPVSSFLMFLTEGFAIVGVDVFVLISGWYGIKLKFTRLAQMGWQLLFFGLVAIAFCWFYDPQNLRGEGVLGRLLLTDGGYWFVKAYVVLYLFAPVLNAFVATASKRQFQLVLVAFFAFEWVYDWLFPQGTRWLQAGYSAPSFMGLYLLARYVRLYQPRFARMSKWVDLGVYLAVALFLAVAVFTFKGFTHLRGGFLYFYDCPAVMAGALALLLFFSKLPRFHSRVVNWLAVSSLACYLTQSSSFVGRYYDQVISGWYHTQGSATFVLLVAAFIVFMFLLSTLLDKVQLLSWRGLTALFRRH